MSFTDKYWEKFYSDGKIDSYLSYKQNQYKQETYNNGTSTTYNRLFDNKSKEHG